MAITAAQVQELRQSTGCGMMDCKKALQDANGDMAQAIEVLRKKGMAKAAGKAGRIATEGLIKLKVGKEDKQSALVEINCETDFVARDDNFKQFAERILATVFSHQIDDIDVLKDIPIDGEKTVENICQELVVKLGENIHVRRMTLLQSDGLLGGYLHGDRIGAVVALSGGNVDMAKDIAMNVVANKPQYISPEFVPEDILAKEREIYRAQVLESGKPESIVDKIVQGRVQKFLSENCLIYQPLVKNPDMTIEALLKEKGATIQAFIRMELGEGIEKKKDNFAQEVMEQAKR